MKRIAIIVLALAALMPAAASAASPSVLSPGNTVTVNADTCVGPIGQRNWFSITAAVGDPSDANKIRIASRAVGRIGGVVVAVHVFPTVETNLNHNTNSLTVARTWRGPARQHTRIRDVVTFIHGNEVVASALRISVPC